MKEKSIALLFENYSLLISQGISLGLIEQQQVDNIEQKNAGIGSSLQQLIHNVADVLTAIKEDVLGIEIPKDPEKLQKWVTSSKDGAKVKCYDAFVDVFILSQKHL